MPTYTLPSYVGDAITQAQAVFSAHLGAAAPWFLAATAAIGGIMLIRSMIRKGMK